MPDKEISQSPQSPQRQNNPEQEQSRSARGTSGESSRQQQTSTRRDRFMPSLWREHPFTMMQRLSTEMERMLDTFGRGGGLFGSRFGRSGEGQWSPEIEMFERDNKLIVCADLPGMKKDDIQLEITDAALIIQGERKHEFTDTQEGYQRSERSYGSFYRTIPLPDDVDPEQMHASFQDGVLKITVPLPPQQQKRQSRRIEIQEQDPSSTREKSQPVNTSGQPTHSDPSLNP